jgi:hypothetical protein
MTPVAPFSRSKSVDAGQAQFGRGSEASRGVVSWYLF